jgi:hypothetical protein
MEFLDPPLFRYHVVPCSMVNTSIKNHTTWFSIPPFWCNMVRCGRGAVPVFPRSTHTNPISCTKSTKSSPLFLYIPTLINSITIYGYIIFESHAAKSETPYQNTSSHLPDLKLHICLLPN